MHKIFTRTLFVWLALVVTACTQYPVYPGISTVHTGWKVQVFQDDREVTGRNNRFKLEKRPFELQINFPAGSALMINALDKDTNFYLDLSIPCDEQLNPFCPGMGLAEGTTPNLNANLVLDPLGSHYITAETVGRWWSLLDTGDGFTGTRLVRTIIVPEGETPYPQTAIEEFPGKQLYLMFYLNTDGDGKISENEIWKVILLFK
jgi:hypothetical protein